MKKRCLVKVIRKGADGGSSIAFVIAASYLILGISASRPRPITSPRSRERRMEAGLVLQRAIPRTFAI
ncbi:hypothetical protein DEA98_26665 [Brucella pseudogrignonensis]|nr:hypothetical protein [Brucella pseudogrignonensis]